MPTLNTKLFDGEEKTLTVYNGEAIIDQLLYFYATEFCDLEETQIDFDFPDYTSSYFRAFNERDGRLLVEVSLSRDGAYLIFNASASDMTFDDLGNYFYEIGYVRGVYEQVLRYGTLQVL